MSQETIFLVIKGYIVQLTRGRAIWTLKITSARKFENLFEHEIFPEPRITSTVRFICQKALNCYCYSNN